MGIEVIGDRSQPLTLQKAILLYGQSPSDLGFATLHDVAKLRNKPPRIMPGQNLGKSHLNEVLSQIKGKRIGCELLPESVLAFDDASLLWWMPPSRQKLYFKVESRDDFGSRSGQCFLPGLVFVANDNSLSVFAFKGSARPNIGTKLFHAPCMNVNGAGMVCTGSMPIPGDTSTQVKIDVWRDGFFRSAFTHTNHERSVRYKGGAYKFWLDMLGGEFPKFPNEVLVPNTTFRVINDLLR